MRCLCNWQQHRGVHLLIYESKRFIIHKLIGPLTKMSERITCDWFDNRIWTRFQTGVVFGDTRYLKDCANQQPLRSEAMPQ